MSLAYSGLCCSLTGSRNGQEFWFSCKSLYSEDIYTPWHPCIISECIYMYIGVYIELHVHVCVCVHVYIHVYTFTCCSNLLRTAVSLSRSLSSSISRTLLQRTPTHVKKCYVHVHKIEHVQCTCYSA